MNASEAASALGGKMFTGASDCANERGFNLFPIVLSLRPLSLFFAGFT